jgi:hypothetical protein
LVQGHGRHPIKPGQIPIQDHPLSPDQDDPRNPGATFLQIQHLGLDLAFSKKMRSFFVSRKK